jgi:hypothetical protein
MLTLNILAHEKRREALCTSCVYEVTQKGYQGEKLTFCNYGGELRELQFEVCECSVYVDSRVARPRKIAGFIKPGETARLNVTIIKIA